MIDHMTILHKELSNILDQYDSIIAKLKSGIMPQELISVEQIEEIIFNSRYQEFQQGIVSERKSELLL